MNMGRGFSLVELSIVLVILGLLTGGILAGQSLIRASELRAVTTEYQRYVTAVATFRDKYFGIPGDFRDATRFWSRQVNAAHCVTNSAAAVSTPGACDGDGDGLIEWPPAASQSGEVHQFWRQLALAGLIEGSYSGYAGSAGIAHCVLGNDCPRSKMTNAGWGTWWPNQYGTPYGDAGTFSLDYGNVIIFGAPQPNWLPNVPILKPEEAWNIDTKLDDGKPAYGNVIALYWANLCSVADDGTSAGTDYAASYKLSDSSIQCAFFFRHAY